MKKDKILGTRPSILVLDEISTDDENAYEVLSYKPSLRERFWKKLGYKYYHTDEPEDFNLEKYADAIFFRTTFSFGFLDRVRLLFTREFKIFGRMYQTEDKIEAVTFIDFEFVAPYKTTKKYKQRQGEI